jgi:hypothetical protein
VSGAELSGCADAKHLGTLLLVLGQPRQALERAREIAGRLEQDRALVKGLGVAGIIGEHGMVGGERFAHRVRITARVLLVEATQVDVGVGEARRRAHRFPESRLRGRVVVVLRLDHPEEVLQKRV